MRYVFAYVGTAAVMGLLDLFWLTVMTPRLYKPALGQMMADKPDMRAAIAFYLIYVAGVVVLAVLPALQEQSAIRAVCLGAALGLVAYATYDLTNQATLRGWPLHLTLLDIAWGVVITASASLAGYLLANAGEKFSLN